MKKKTVRKSSVSKKSTLKKSTPKKSLSKKSKFSLKTWLVAGVLAVVALGIGYSLSQQKSLTVLDIPGEITDYIKANPIDINAINNNRSNLPISDDPYAAAAMAAAKTKVQQKTLAAQQAPKTEDAAARQRREAREEAEIEAAMAEAARQAAATALAFAPSQTPIATEIKKIAEQAVKQVKATTEIQLKHGSTNEYELKPIINPAPHSTDINCNITCKTKAGFPICAGETVIGNAIASGGSEVRQCNNDGSWGKISLCTYLPGNPNNCKVTILPTFLGGNLSNCNLNGLVVGNGSVVDNNGKKEVCQDGKLVATTTVAGKIQLSESEIAKREESCTKNGGAWDKINKICGGSEASCNGIKGTWDPANKKCNIEATTIRANLDTTDFGKFIEQCRRMGFIVYEKEQYCKDPSNDVFYWTYHAPPVQLRTGGATKTECETNLATLSDKENKHCVAIGYGAYQIKDKPRTPTSTDASNILSLDDCRKQVERNNKNEKCEPIMAGSFATGKYRIVPTASSTGTGTSQSTTLTPTNFGQGGAGGGQSQTQDTSTPTSQNGSGNVNPHASDYDNNNRRFADVDGPEDCNLEFEKYYVQGRSTKGCELRRTPLSQAPPVSDPTRPTKGNPVALESGQIKFATTSECSAYLKSITTNPAISPGECSINFLWLAGSIFTPNLPTQPNTPPLPDSARAPTTPTAPLSGIYSPETNPNYKPVENGTISQLVTSSSGSSYYCDGSDSVQERANARPSKTSCRLYGCNPDTGRCYEPDDKFKHPESGKGLEGAVCNGNSSCVDGLVCNNKNKCELPGAPEEPTLWESLWGGITNYFAPKPVCDSIADSYCDGEGRLMSCQNGRFVPSPCTGKICAVKEGQAACYYRSELEL